MQLTQRKVGAAAVSRLSLLEEQEDCNGWAAAGGKSGAAGGGVVVARETHGKMLADSAKCRLLAGFRTFGLGELPRNSTPR